VTGDVGFVAVSFPANSIAADHTPTNSATKIHTVSSAAGSLWDNWRILGTIPTPNGGESTSLGAANWAAVFIVYKQATVVTPGYAGVHSPAIPTVITEIAFATQPADAVATWTDISQYVKEIHTKLGRTNPLEDIDAGTLQLILDNRDRRFEPLFGAGPYYPNVKPLKRVRCYALENPLVDPNFENKNAGGQWTGYQGNGVLSVPAYGTTPAAPFGDWKLQTDIGSAAGPTYTGIQQVGVTFNKMPATGEYVGISVYIYASKAGAINLVLANQAGTQIAFTTQNLVAGAWTRITTSGAVPAGTTSFTFIAQPTGGGVAAWANNDLIYYDAAKVHAFRTTNSNFIPQTPSDWTTQAPYTKTVYLFDGYIEGWPQVWAGGMQAEVTVTAVDGFKPLAPMQVVRGDYNLIVTDDLPTWYFRLGEQLTTQAAQNEVASGIQDGAYTVSGAYPILNQVGPMVGDYDGAAKFGAGPAGVAGRSDVHRTNVVVPTKQLAWEAWVKFDTTVPGASPDNSGDTYVGFCHGDNTTAGIVQVGWDYFTAAAGAPYTGMHMNISLEYGNNWGYIQYYVQTPANTAAYWTSWHHLAWSWDGTGADGKAGVPRVYFDGVEVDLTSAGQRSYSSALNILAGNSAGISKGYLGKLTEAGKGHTMYIGNDYTTLFGLRNVTLDEVAYYVDKIPKDGWAARHFAGQAMGATVEDSGTRMGHLLDQASIPGSGLNPWPAPRRAIDTGVSQVIGWRWSEEKLIDLVKQDTKSEGGTFFFDGHGFATFLNRWHPIQYPYCIPKATLTDQPVSANLLAPYEDVGSGGVDYDDTDIYNDITISRYQAGYGDASGAQSVNDAASQNDYMIRSLTLDDTIVTTDQEALNAASWYLSLFKNPGIKIKTLQIEPLDQPENLWRIIANTSISDRLSVVRHPPPGSGTPMTFEVLIQGIQHDILPGEWHVNYQVYPGPSRDFWQLPDSATNDEFAQFSVLGTTTRLAY
jgi:hypothetical protein